MDSTTLARDFLMKDAAVVFKDSQGMEVQARLLHLSRHQVAFEIQSSGVLVQTSEVLSDFRVVMENRPVYSGRAVVASVVNAGVTMVCQASLEEQWLGSNAVRLALDPRQLEAGFEEFLGSWQKFYRILPEYKTVIADLQTFLTDLRLWLDQIEMGLRSAPPEDQAKLESEIAHGLRDPISKALESMFERFEAVANTIEDDRHAAHRAFGQRQLHHLLMCAPFIHRTYAKPLGYAGGG